MQITIMLALVLTAVLFVLSYRKKRDQDELTGRITERHGQVVRLVRVRKGSPFTDTGRGWWAWRVDWRDEAGQHQSWALTTREGIKEWRD